MLFLCSSDMEVRVSEDFGRHYVATRDIKPGTIILSEYPALVRPFGPDNCLSCSTRCPEVKCPECSWPICSDKCAQSPSHSQNECLILRSNEVKYDVNKTQGIYPAIYLIRGLFIKFRDPQLWSQIDGLLHKKSSAIFTTENDKKFWTEFVNARKFLSTLKLPFNYNEKDLDVLEGVLKLNGFYTIDRDFEEKTNSTTVMLLYPNVSLFSNACFPNCSKDINCGPQFQTHIWTAVPVSKGQILSISYFGSRTIGSMARQKSNLQNEGYFLCLCPRCIDPTELGSNFSAIKCLSPNCPVGYLLPQNPTNLLQDSIFKCNNCESKKIFGQVEKLTQEIEKKIEDFDAYSMEEMDNFLKYLNKFLHENHWLIRNTLLKFYEKICNEINVEVNQDPKKLEISRDRIDFLIFTIKKLLNTTNYTSPGLSTEMGEWLENLYNVLSYKFRQLCKNNEDFDLVLKEILKIIPQILTIKKLEPSSTYMNGESSQKIRNFEKDFTNFTSYS